MQKFVMHNELLFKISVSKQPYSSRSLISRYALLISYIMTKKRTSKKNKEQHKVQITSQGQSQATYPILLNSITISAILSSHFAFRKNKKHAIRNACCTVVYGRRRACESVQVCNFFSFVKFLQSTKGFIILKVYTKQQILMVNGDCNRKENCFKL